MHTLALLGPETFSSMPWRNGLGTTVELLKQNRADGDGFAWRLSMADVTSDGEFSNFGGYDRTLLLLEGGGLTLDCAGVQHRLEQPLQAARFRGEDTTIATLHDGPVKDFNIITSRQICNARVNCVVHAEESTLDVDTDILLLYVVDGELAVRGSVFDNLHIPSGHLCVVRDPAKESARCHGASYIATQITYHAASTNPG